MKVSAVITSLDNLANLRDSVAILRHDPLISQIIVVNNGSIDGTQEWLAGQPDLIAINRANNGAGPGRNAGLDAAGQFDYVLLLDGGIRPLKGGTGHMLDYLERRPDADVIGVEIPDFETDPTKAWLRWPNPIGDRDTYVNTRLSHTAYCLARWRAWDGIRFSEAGPFGEPGWGADDDELACQWQEHKIAVHVIVGIHPYRRGSGSFRRLWQETGIWPNQYGSVYERRVVWLQQNWPQYQQGIQWGEPWLTVVIKIGETESTIKLIKSAHDALRLRCFEPPWQDYPNPYSVIAWGPPGLAFWDWAESRALRQHHGNITIIDGEIIRRNPSNEALWTGDFRLWHGADWPGAIRPGAYYYGLVKSQEDLTGLLERYNKIHPPKLSNFDYPGGRGEL